MRCGACAQAITGTGGADYRRGCRACDARMLADMACMRDAMDKRLSREERDLAGMLLRQEIERLMPHVPYDDARAAVLSWWKVRNP